MWMERYSKYLEGEKMNNDEMDIDIVDLEDIIQREKGDKRDDARKTKGWKIIMILVILSGIVAILFQFLFISEKDDRYANYNGTYNTVRNNDTSINLNEEDKKFIGWVSISYVPIDNDLTCIATAAKKENLSDTEHCAKFLKEDAQRPMKEIDKFNNSNISSFVNLAIFEYGKALENYYIGGRDLEIGAKNKDVELMSNASIYIKEGNVHVKKASSSIPKNI